jgi:hypothetical protein
VVPRSLLCEPLTVENLTVRMLELKSNPEKMRRDGEDYANHIRKTCTACEMTRKITEFYHSA